MKNIEFPIFETIMNKKFPPGNEQSINEKLVRSFIKSLSGNENVNSSFFQNALKSIQNETESVNISINDSASFSDILKEYWKIFFPEALLFYKNQNDVIKDIRKRRTVTIDKLNSNPIQDIPGEMTFTSNILLTIPDKDTNIEDMNLPYSIKDTLPSIMEEKQLYWFDHPVQIGEIQEKNEIIYGLKGLSEALEYEKREKNVEKNAKLDVLLSVSVTHNGLHKIAAPYLKHELSLCKGIKDLNIYIFTEDECKILLDELSMNSEDIGQYFGVDGKYSRHYNFLKAINVFWKLAINPRLKGTFKFDLDQVFPQEELKTCTGKTAFEHFRSPLWGAGATDCNGKKVDLSMIAGALVNESDIKKSLFTPDVSIPTENAPLHDLVFFKHYTMAISTRAELMTRYKTDNNPDGEKQALTRIHVTGGTNGILIDALGKYRPFTPAFIGRAEDQAYILSVLNDKRDKVLRYYHEDGLIMRHDKEAFAGESIMAAKDGTYIADILRILYYSYYSKLLPGGLPTTKESTFPFTGSYISNYPITLAYIRFSFKLLELYENGETERADIMLELGKNRILPLVKELEDDSFLKNQYEDEKKQWDIFYNEFETAGDSMPDNRKSNIKKILESCRIM